jgi:hypothetical protein
MWTSSSLTSTGTFTKWIMIAAQSINGFYLICMVFLLTAGIYARCQRYWTSGQYLAVPVSAPHEPTIEERLAEAPSGEIELRRTRHHIEGMPLEAVYVVRRGTQLGPVVSTAFQEVD